MRLSWQEARRLIPNLDDLLRRQGSGDHKPPGPAAPAVPTCTRLEVSPGRWRVTIENYMPASDNVRAKGTKAWIRAKRADREVIRDWLVDFAKVPRASCRRRLEVHIEKRGPMIDPSNLNKSLRDALVNCGLLVNDNPEWLEAIEPTAVRAKTTTTTVILTDLA